MKPNYKIPVVGALEAGLGIAIASVVLASVLMYVTPVVADAHMNEYGEGQSGHSDNGSITVCAVLRDVNGTIATSSSGVPATTFTIPLSFFDTSAMASSTGSSSPFGSATSLDPIVFTAADFSSNAHILSVSGNNADCITRTNLPLGYYIYGEEEISGTSDNDWNVQYNDRPAGTVDFSDFADYSPTNENSDGNIILNTDDEVDRTLVVLNTLSTSFTSSSTSPSSGTSTATSTPCDCYDGHGGHHHGHDGHGDMATSSDDGAGMGTSTDDGTTGTSTDDGTTATSTSDGSGSGTASSTESTSSSVSSSSSHHHGGSGSTATLQISNEHVESVVPGIAMVEWDTNRTATSQVVYGTHSVSDNDLDNGSDGKYGYDLKTVELTELLTTHGVAVGGIQAGVTYYFRPISTKDGITKVGDELTFAPAETPTEGGESCVYMYDYLKRGWANNPTEVKKLQIFLHDIEGHSDLAITGVFDDATFEAVSEFQEKYTADILTPWGYDHATGFSYILTTKKINEIYCHKVFPLTAEQQQEIVEYKAFYLNLKQQGITSGGNTIPPRTGNPPPYAGSTTTPVPGEDNGVIIDEGEVGMATGTGSTTNPLDRGVLRNLAAAVFSFPQGTAETTRCIFNFIIILAIIYIVTSILVSNEEGVLLQAKVRMRKLMFFIGGTIIALAFALFFDMYCLILPLGVTFLVILGLVIWNKSRGGKTPGPLSGGTGGGTAVPPKMSPLIVEEPKVVTTAAPVVEEKK